VKKRWVSILLMGFLLFNLARPIEASENNELQDEIIYDLLVDRFFNKGIQNDINVNSLDPNSFSGGDFAGLSSEMQYIKDMGFTMISVGPVFSATSYDGTAVVDYDELESRFGTQEEWEEVINKAHELDLKVMIDLPTQKLSEQHVWRESHPEWFVENENGTIALETANREVQDQLIGQFEGFIEKYAIDGIRIKKADSLDPAFITRFSESLKSIRDLYVISDDVTPPQDGLDAVVMPGIETALRDSYKSFNPNETELSGSWEEAEGKLIQVDSLLTSRFTADTVQEGGFPPTRWKLLTFQLLTMPGIPVIQYGSEIAVNGQTAPDTHPILDLGVDEELIDHIANLTSLRNQSAALRTGSMEVLHEEDGWFVYKRSNEEETWIIAINNSSSTQSLTLPASVVGDDKELRGLFENNIARQDEEGNYRITLDRELGEAFNIIEQKGFNKAYIAALVVLYISFLTFLFLAWRRGRKKKKAATAKK